MTNCNFCKINPATIGCEKCKCIKFCNKCVKNNIISFMCTDCIISAKDCNYCVDAWTFDNYGNYDKARKLKLACVKCVKGYCEDCVINNRGVAECPQCFDNLNMSEDDLGTKCKEIEYKISDDDFDLEDSNKFDKMWNSIKKGEEKISTLDYAKQLEELELLGKDGPHSVTAPVRRRRPMIYEKEKEKEKEEPQVKIEVKQKRADNVQDVLADSTLAMHTISTDIILINQAAKRLKTKYKLDKKFLELIFTTRSLVLGSFPLEIILAESYVDSNLNIYCTEHGMSQLKTLLLDYTKVESQKEDKQSFIRYTEIWESNSARIQFVVANDVNSVRNYLELADMSIVQNTFNGRVFQIADMRTLNKIGTVFDDPTSLRVKKYFDRGYELYIKLTPRIAENTFQ